MRHITDGQRRTRLAVRHGLHPDHRLNSPSEVARGMTVLHGSEAPTVHLSIAARTPWLSIQEVDKALYEDRSIVKQLGMRRTLWAVPTDLLPAVWGSASSRVAAAERKRLVKAIETGGIAEDGSVWLATACDAVERLLAAGGAYTAAELRDALPELTGRIERSPGKPYASIGAIAPDVLALMGAEGRIVRAQNASHWRVSRSRWTATTTWLPEAGQPLDEQTGYAESVRRWLRTFGPGTEADLVWWLGAPKSAVRRALLDVQAASVTLDSGEIGWVLPDDLEAPEDFTTPSPWAALLPVLDPTTMGWRARDFYLPSQHVPYLFDSVGNGGTTAWVNGRIVGSWVQDDKGRVEVVPLEELSTSEHSLVDAQAAALTEWLGGQVVTNVYKSAIMSRRRLP